MVLNIYIPTVYIYPHGIYIDQSDFQYSDYSVVAVIIIIIIVCMCVHLVHNNDDD